VDASDRSRSEVVVRDSEDGIVNVCGGGVRAGADDARDAGRSVCSRDLGWEAWSIVLSADSDLPQLVQNGHFPSTNSPQLGQRRESLNCPPQDPQKR